MNEMTHEAVPCRCSPPCKPQSKWVDGLEFRIPTWCKTPQLWNPSGSWLKDNDNLEQIKAAIRKASDLDALETLIKKSDHSQEEGEGCPTFWGSHGCSLSEGHAGLWHVCGPLDDPCMAVANWGDRALLVWSIDGPRNEWEPWGLYWEFYS